jgi:DDT domain/Williams-Beuren syndrome DDT (WSD), D-TOX E motif
MSSPPPDPDVPYPTLLSDFGGVPARFVGKLLQIWDFVVAFGRILRVPSCTLTALEGAISASTPQPLINCIVIRLVYTIIADKNLTEELEIQPNVAGTLNVIKPSKRASSADAVLKVLPSMLSYEPNDTEVEDRELARIADVLSSSDDSAPFYSALEPIDRIRVLGELVEYACMADSLRECVQDSIEHAVEERKKAREEVVANRRKLEVQLKDLRDELDLYRTRHNLESRVIDDTIVSTEPGLAAKASHGLKSDGAVHNIAGDVIQGEAGGLQGAPPSLSPSDTDVGSDEVMRVCESNGKRIMSEGWDKLSAKKLSRKQKLDVARRERDQERERRELRRGEEVIELKIERVRAALKALRSVRLRQPRESNKDTPTSTNGFEAPLVNLDSGLDPVRVYSLGTDRNERGYWFFPAVGRLWVEDLVTREWSYLAGGDEISKLLTWLSPSRRSEAALAAAISKCAPAIASAALKASRRDALIAASPVDAAVDEGEHVCNISKSSSDCPSLEDVERGNNDSEAHKSLEEARNQ